MADPALWWAYRRRFVVQDNVPSRTPRYGQARKPDVVVDEHRSEETQVNGGANNPRTMTETMPKPSDKKKHQFQELLGDKLLSAICLTYLNSWGLPFSIIHGLHSFVTCNPNWRRWAAHIPLSERFSNKLLSNAVEVTTRPIQSTLQSPFSSSVLSSKLRHTLFSPSLSHSCFLRYILAKWSKIHCIFSRHSTLSTSSLITSTVSSPRSCHTFEAGMGGRLSRTEPQSIHFIWRISEKLGTRN